MRQFSVIGHRGDGANGCWPVRPLQFMENTVASFNEAARLRADMVEFDVQLSKDLEPVIFHDFFICTGQNHYHVSKLSLSELSSLYLDEIEPLAPQPNPFYDGEKCLKCKRSDPQNYQLIKDSIPTLAQAFNQTHVAFNIELKYPTRDEVEEWNLEGIPDLQLYCQTIMKTIALVEPSRKIVFSSFNPDVCAWIKDSTEYDVMFLTEAGEARSKYDPRLNSLEEAYKLAAGSGLKGIVAYTTGLFKSSPSTIHNIVSEMALYTYGRDNCDKEQVIRQLELGVTGIITDDLRLVTEISKK